METESGRRPSAPGCIRDPYPFFALKRNEAGVFRGSVMDYSKTPENLRPKQNYAAMSFDAVNTVFRDGKLFNSAMYDATIGMFIGPTILAMGGRDAPGTPQSGFGGIQVEVVGALGTRDRATRSSTRSSTSSSKPVRPI